MKKTALISMILLAIAVMATTACDPTSLSLDGSRQVKFTATSHVSPMTKTVYGGYTQDSTYQTIRWVAGDKVRIWSPAGGGISGTHVPSGLGLDYVYADYTLKNVAHDENIHQSKATLNNVDPNGLIWSGSDDAVFYAAYPGDKVKAAATRDNQFEFAFPLSADQSGDPREVKNMPMLSKQKVRNGAAVELEFYPAFNVIEFNLSSAINESFTVDSVVLYKAGTSFDPLTGSLCYYDINGSAPRVTSVDEKGYSIKLEVNKTISPSTPATFTFFMLPFDHEGLVFKVHSKKTVNGATEESTRTLELKQNGAWVKFPVGHKAVIKGMALDPDLWCYQTITLNGEKIEWWPKSETTTSGENPEASQFAITGVQNVYQQHRNDEAYKKYRQTWPLESVDSTATVSFKIMSPRSTSTQNATYTITPQGDYTSFIIKVGETIVTGPWSGNIAATGGATKISFTVTPTAAAVADGTKKMWFTTSVTAVDGTVFNIDSETQLYDTRGYHYFVTKCPCGVVH